MGRTFLQGVPIAYFGRSLLLLLLLFLLVALVLVVVVLVVGCNDDDDDDDCRGRRTFDKDDSNAA